MYTRMYSVVKEHEICIFVFLYNWYDLYRFVFFKEVNTIFDSDIPIKLYPAQIATI